MRFGGMALVAVAAMMPAPASAQVDAGNTILPMTYTQPGWAERAVKRNDLWHRTRDFEDRNCVRIGCFIILNETSNYVVTGLYFVRGERDGVREWTPNQFDRPLIPRTVFYSPKAGDDNMCHIPVKVVVQEIDTGETLEIEDFAGLCRREKASTLLRVNVVKPSVTILP
jgi:hypothetical protein